MGKRIAGINLAKNGSLAIINDGEIEFYLEEERATRIKRDISAKALASKYIDSDIHAVTICDCFTRYNRQTYIERTREKHKLCKIIRSRGCNNIIDYRQRHHDCHAANAFYHSGFDDAAVIVMDGKGSFHNHDGYSFCETESIYDNLTPVFKHYSTFWNEEEKLPVPYWSEDNFYSDRVSIGQAFRTVSRYCGFDEIEAGKTMGLSAYGHPDTPVDLFNEEYGHSVCSLDIKPSGNTTKYTGTKYIEADLAYNMQKSAERHAIFMVKKAVQLTGKKNICVSGGFFLNCVANYAIIKEMDINLYTDPIAYDGGLAIGSALYENTLLRS
tara:strand:- start:387 stop:1367 length:981 start_codon:yes stop_codon:yes gene_type:complete